MNLVFAWISAARPKTLSAAALPVFVAWVLASSEDYYRLDLLLYALGAAICLQIATNFWNDYFDFKKGSDGEGRLGPRRLLQKKIATPKEVFCAAILFNLFSFFLAVPIFQERGWALLLLGLVCIALSIAYTGGPLPLAYLGLGELFVLLFFGWVATAFSFYVAVGYFSSNATLLGLQVGLLSSVLITINNIRDFKEDRKNKKNTLVARFGKKFGMTLLSAELFIPYLLNLLWPVSSKFYLVLLALPLAVLIYKNMQAFNNPNKQLAFASMHAVLYLSLWAVGALWQ